MTALYDYVQHGRNVIGHCAPASTPRLETLKRTWATVWPPNLRRWLRQLLEFGQTHDVRYDPARQFARLLLARCESVLAPGRQRSLRRLANADRSWTAWTWLAVRGLWHRRVTLGADRDARLIRLAGAEPGPRSASAANAGRGADQRTFMAGCRTGSRG